MHGPSRGQEKKSKGKSNTSPWACPLAQESTTCNLVSYVPKIGEEKLSKGLPKEAPPKEGDDNENNNQDGFVGGPSRERVPSLGHMWRFASDRGVLADLI